MKVSPTIAGKSTKMTTNAIREVTGALPARYRVIRKEPDPFPPTHHIAKPSPDKEPAHLRDDPGLACLTSQLGRIDAQIRQLARLREEVAEAEGECARELAALSAGESRPTSSNDGTDAEPSDEDVGPCELVPWVKKWDPEVGAEYFFNMATGEASWLDPRIVVA